MNDKCASGTGATIDKCFVKVNAPPEMVLNLDFDPTKLHHVAAKCGVFAETDIVNLIKSGIPASEVLSSLADAIVMQNLSVLTRGSTLKHKVLLLGGPNTYLKFLQQCWRLRIPQTWKERGHDYPKDIPIEELIFVPENSHLYAAYGAVMYGLHEDAVGRLAQRSRRVSATTSRTDAKRAWARPQDRRSPRTRKSYKDFRELYAIPKFEPAKFDKDEVVHGVIGLDGGSTSSKAVLIDYELGQDPLRRRTSSRRATRSRTRKSSSSRSRRTSPIKARRST